MTASGVRGIDLFKIAGRPISGWIPSLKTGNPYHARQPFCSQLEERLLMYLEYHPQVAWYARGDISAHFAATYWLPMPKQAPFAIGYVFEGKPYDYLPDVVEMLARRHGGVYWLGTEQTLLLKLHYNFISLHVRRQGFPDFAEISTALYEVWPWGEVASVEEVGSRLLDRWSPSLVKAAIWKMVADAAARGHLLVDLVEAHLDRRLPLALLPPDAPSIVPDPLPDTLPYASDQIHGGHEG